MKKLFLFGFLILSIGYQSLISDNSKFSLWQKPAYFRGMDLMYSRSWTISEISELKAAGANLAQLECCSFLNSFTYAPIDSNIAKVDSMVLLCRQAKLYYTIAFREGPGRRDVYAESNGLATKSSVWQNPDEQKLYASMIKTAVSRYKDDSLFVGISPFVEPDPLFDTVFISSSILKAYLERNGIDVPAIYKLIIDSIRTIDPDIPVLVQNVNYSCPEFFDLEQKQNDNRVVYELHSYRPSGYANSTDSLTQSYPGNYFYLPSFSNKYYDKKFISDTLFQFVNKFQSDYSVPIFMGEFGLLFKQINGVQFLTDLGDIAIEKGWHFALWLYKAGMGWDYQFMGSDYWNCIKNLFVKDKDYVPESKNNSDIEVNYFEGSLIISGNLNNTNSVTITDLLGRNFFYQDNLEFSTNIHLLVNNSKGVFVPGIYLVFIRTDKQIISKKFIIF